MEDKQKTFPAHATQQEKINQIKAEAHERAVLLDLHAKKEILATFANQENASELTTKLK